MLIKTDESLIKNRTKITQTIANFWNQTSVAWKTIWGLHIHHGFYTDKVQTPKAAQEKLIEKLAEKLAMTSEQKVLDVGCGMGGSSIFLAQKYAVEVYGITLSQKQIEIATQEAKQQNIRQVEFCIEDALNLNSFADNSFDIVWSLESCEQFYDKNQFIQSAYRVLKPGGKLLLATWCSDREEYKGSAAKKYKALCHAFDLPYMPTINCYQRLLKDQRFNLLESHDWTAYVEKTWDNGISLVNAYSFWQLIKLIRWRAFRVKSQLKQMQDAYREQRLRYGVFVAVK